MGIYTETTRHGLGFTTSLAEFLIRELTQRSDFPTTAKTREIPNPIIATKTVVKLNKLLLEAMNAIYAMVDNPIKVNTDARM